MTSWLPERIKYLPSPIYMPLIPVCPFMLAHCVPTNYGLMSLENGFFCFLFFLAVQLRWWSVCYAVLFLVAEHKTNDRARGKINFLVGPQEPLPANVKRRKLAWFGHIQRHDSLYKTIRHGTLEGGRRRGRQRKCWMDSIKEWTSLPMPETGLLARGLEEELC